MPEIITKLCRGCDLTKPLDEFVKARGRKHGRASRCLSCKRKHSKDCGNRNFRKWKYNVSFEQFQEMKRAQCNKCAICETDRPGGRGTWHLDHDHNCCPMGSSCGKCVRGLLCRPCNVKLGVREQVDWNAKAAIYQAKYKSGDATNG